MVGSRIAGDRRVSWRAIAPSVVISFAMVAVSCGGDDGQEAGLSERSLQDIPLVVYDDVAPVRDGFVQILVGDVVAVADFLRADPPEPGRNEDDILDWYVELGGFRADDDEPNLGLFFNTLPDSNRARPSEILDDVGLDIGAIERFTEISTSDDGPITTLTTLHGPLTVSDELDETAGVFSLGVGDDFEIRGDQRSSVSPIGFPIRLGQGDGAVALSQSTPAVEAWLDDEAETLADEERYLTVARALDSLGSIAAFIFESDFEFVTGAIDASPDDLAQQIESLDVIEEPFDMVAIGTIILEDDIPASAIIYMFDDDAAAEGSLDQIEDVWRGATTFSNRRPVADVVEFESISRTNSLVTVIVVPADGRSTTAPLQFLFARDIMFSHR